MRFKTAVLKKTVNNNLKVTVMKRIRNNNGKCISHRDTCKGDN